MTTITLPDRSEAAEYYYTYIDKVPRDQDICRAIEGQLPEALQLLTGISDEKSLHKYAADKWTIREVVGHINDCERLFVFRAMWFARGFDSELPSFDQDLAIAGARSNDRPWKQLVDEFRALREASIYFYRSLPDDAWSKRGLASGNPFTVRALAYITAGHAQHHLLLLRERYL